MTAEAPQILWLVEDLDGRRIGQVINDDINKAIKIACTVLGKTPEQIRVVDSGYRKPRCCGRRKTS